MPRRQKRKHGVSIIAGLIGRRLDAGEEDGAGFGVLRVLQLPAPEFRDLGGCSWPDRHGRWFRQFADDAL